MPTGAGEDPRWYLLAFKSRIPRSRAQPLKLTRPPPDSPSTISGLPGLDLYLRRVASQHHHEPLIPGTLTLPTMNSYCALLTFWNHQTAMVSMFHP